MKDPYNENFVALVEKMRQLQDRLRKSFPYSLSLHDQTTQAQRDVDRWIKQHRARETKQETPA